MFSNGFWPLVEVEHVQGIKVGGRGFQKLKEPLRETPGILANFVRRTKFLTFLCVALIVSRVREPGLPTG
jgi:hypothetical protein